MSAHFPYGQTPMGRPHSSLPLGGPHLCWSNLLEPFTSLILSSIGPIHLEELNPRHPIHLRQIPTSSKIQNHLDPQISFNSQIAWWGMTLVRMAYNSFRIRIESRSHMVLTLYPKLVHTWLTTIGVIIGFLVDVEMNHDGGLYPVWNLI